MTIAVCLLTCNRPELTQRTASAFVKHNGDRDDLVLLHCDGGSDTFANANIAQRFGFRTLIAPTERIGQMETLRIFLAEAERIGAKWLLWLENDWETERPLPDPEFFDRANRADIETIRLFGVRKMPGDGPRALAGIHRMGTKTVIDWHVSREFDGWLRGNAHWACGGSLIRTDVLKCYVDLPGLKQIMQKANDLITLRPRQNLVWHIGEETTAGFMP